ncbi:hypothetical protein GCM10020367_70650 [Streptomyces sannanensis]|uniref:Uncharacterized protein n=1 Tax=Streptomyces sannanensis TaxID=285536 RepID=A0ABP6SNG1_9ACTN
MTPDALPSVRDFLHLPLLAGPSRCQPTLAPRCGAGPYRGAGVRQAVRTTCGTPPQDGSRSTVTVCVSPWTVKTVTQDAVSR